MMTLTQESGKQAMPPVVYGLLASRTVLFASLQGLIALALVLAGVGRAWEESIAWWPVAATIGNFGSIVLLNFVLRGEESNLRALLMAPTAGSRPDLRALALILSLGAVFALLPDVTAANVLFGSPEAAQELFFRPLPLWAALFALSFFPITIALSELTTYYGYVMPRLRERLGGRWRAITITALAHALQQIALPLVFDWRFMLWRLGGFLPFALFLAITIDRRPRLLLWLILLHGLFDSITVGIVFSMSRGG